jgi:DNA modification methylase
MKTKLFAPEYDRDEHDWVLFPRDDDYRKEMFPPEVNQHPAKANVYLVQAIIEYVSEYDQTILDPMSGTGTLMVGSMIGRNSICIEISPVFHGLQRQAVDKLETIAPGVSSRISLINLPCQKVMPIPNWVDHIITSPPYASIMKSKGTDKLTSEKGMNTAEYSFTSPMNLGQMNDWLWAQEMKKIYQKGFQSLKPGGTMSLIVKDHMKDRQRVMLSQAALDACLQVGFESYAWFKWKAPGSVFTNIYRSRGWEVVDDEDIVIVRRPT